MKKHFLLALSLLLALTLSGCGLLENIESFIGKDSSSASEESVPEPESSEESGEPETPEWPVIVEGVTVPEQPQSVAVLSPSLYELLRGMGADAAVTGVGSYCENPSALPELGTALDPDTDAMIALAPQYLLTSADLPEQQLKLLQQAGIEVIVLAPAKRLSELETLYANLGLFACGLTEGKELSEQYWLSCTELLTEAAKKAKTLEGAETALYLRIAQLTVATADTLEGELLTRLGFVNAAEKYGGWTYPEEDTDALSPDVIIADSAVTEEELEKSKLYADCPAVKNGLVVRTDMEVFERQGRGMFEALLRAVTELCG